jgi:hypothetical protein
MLADLIKIHCLAHRVTFPMSRTSRTVVCKEGGEEHTLSANFPNQGLWIHCCNCQTFIAWDSARGEVTVRECPFCLSSMNPRLYACDRCAVTMVDYDDQTLRKQHMVLSWGMPQPACPGCHQFPGSTPKQHFCEALNCSLATARASCPFCGISVDQFTGHGASSGNGARSIGHGIDPALVEAQIKARDAEERTRLAEATARKEIELRVQAERKAEEIERKITRELVMPQGAALEPDWSRREAEAARARAETETLARREAEAKALEAEQLRQQAETAAHREAEMRAAAEQRAHEITEAFTGNLVAHANQPVSRKDKVTIALYSALAGVLFVLLLLLIVTMIRLSGA